MKKRIIILSILTAASPSVLLLSCTKNAKVPLSNELENIDFNIFKKKNFDSQMVEAKEIYNHMLDGDIKTYSLDSKEYNIDYSNDKKLKNSTKSIFNFYEKYFPSFIKGNSDKLVNTGVTKEFNKNYKIPKMGTRLTASNMPKAPSHTHWIFSSDDFFKPNPKEDYWTYQLRYFRIPMEKPKNTYVVKAKLEADFGYIINNNDILKLTWKK